MKIARYVFGSFVLGLLIAQCAHGELVAHWRLNEGAGDIFADTAGGFDGFLPKEGDRDDGLVPTIEWVNDGPLPGVLESSVRFTGADGPSFIETPYYGVGGANPRTITAWIKGPPQTSPLSAIVAYGHTDTGTKWHFKIDSGGGGTRIRTEYNGGQQFGSSVAIEEDVWHHVASVFPDGGTEGDDVLHYIDGVFEPKAGGTSPMINTIIDPEEGALPVHIGYAVHHAGRYFTGQIADVRFYDEALDEAAILDIVSGAGFLPPGATPGDFNDDGNVDFADFSIIAANMNRTFSKDEDSFSQGDGDSNFRVDMKDFLALRRLVESQGGAAQAVPEPDSFCCFLVPFMLGIAYLRPKRRR